MGGGGVDMRKIRVLRLRGVVWVDVSREGLGGHVPERESGGGGACCLAERGTRAHGSKYLPRMSPRTGGRQ